MATSKLLTYSAAAVVLLTLAACGAGPDGTTAKAASPATVPAPASAITQAENLPPNTTPDTRMHIFWNPAEGKNADPVQCKAQGGQLENFYGAQRCFTTVKKWLAAASGNVVGEICGPKGTSAFPALMDAKDVQEVKAKNALAWTSADSVPFGYKQSSYCQTR